MENIKITFFMLVTTRDIIIADYAIISYTKIKNIPFKLQVYSNWIPCFLKQKYFPAWRQLDYVELIENEWQTDDKCPSGSGLEGRYEKCATVWERELKKIETPYFATVDADFEILDAKFISVMLDKVDAYSNLAVMSTDYQPTIPDYYESYENEVICLQERWNTWFCIYRQEALQCPVSHHYYKEIVPGSEQPKAWDEAGYFQKGLKDIFGFDLAALDAKYQPCFIHYGAFSKNVDINESNVQLYRQIQILRKRGFFGTSSWRTGLLGILDIFPKKAARLLNKIVFRKADRSKYVGDAPA